MVSGGYKRYFWGFPSNFVALQKAFQGVSKRFFKRKFLAGFKDVTGGLQGCFRRLRGVCVTDGQTGYRGFSEAFQRVLEDFQPVSEELQLLFMRFERGWGFQKVSGALHAI